MWTSARAIRARTALRVTTTRTATPAHAQLAGRELLVQLVSQLILYVKE